MRGVQAVGDGDSAWHQDAIACPLDTDRMVTLWIALVDVEAGMGPLQASPAGCEWACVARLAPSAASRCLLCVSPATLVNFDPYVLP